MKEESVAPNKMICQCLTYVRPFKMLDECCIRIRIQALKKSFFFRRCELEERRLVPKRTRSDHAYKFFFVRPCGYNEICDEGQYDGQYTL